MRGSSPRMTTKWINSTANRFSKSRPRIARSIPGSSPGRATITIRQLLRMPPNRSNIYLLYTARCLRGFGDGFAVIILPAYLSAIGLNPIEIGLVATASLFGTAVLTLLIGLIAPRHDLRNMLLLGAGLMAFTGIALPSFEYLTFIAAVAFV